MPEVTGIIESVIYVDEMQRSVEFYERVFEFPREYASDRITALRVASRQILLVMQRGASLKPSVMSFGTIPPSDARGHQHLAFGIPPSQFDQWLTRLEVHGVAIENRLDWPEGGQSLYIRDPDDHCIELKTSDWGGTLLGPPAKRNTI